METAAAASTEIMVLGWSVILLVVQVIAQASLTSKDNGPAYAAGNHESAPNLSPVAKRVKNALANLLETYPAFIGLALALAVTGRTGSYGAIGAVVWIAARAAYLAIYAAGIPGVRTLAWLGSIVGLAMMLYRLMAGA